jgi:hypothetical protein
VRYALEVSAGILTIFTYILYWIAIVRGSTKPVRVTWLIWALLDIIAASAMAKTHTLNWHISCAAAGASVTFSLSLWRGKRGFSTIDAICLLGSAIGIVCYFASSATSAIIASMITGMIAFLPTAASAYQQPQNEDRLAWTLSALSSWLMLIAVQQWTIDGAAQPATFVAITTTTAILAWRKPNSSPI